MTQPLPGFVDTGITFANSVAGKVDFRDSHFWRPEGAPGPVPSGSLGGRDQITFNLWILYSNPFGSFCPPPSGFMPWVQGTYELWTHHTAAPIADVKVHAGGFA